MPSLEYIDTTIVPVMELLVVPMITVYYFINKATKKALFFTLFLVTFSISDILHLIDRNTYSDPIYYLCSWLYILSFVFLLIEISRYLNLKHLIKKFPVQIIVLIILTIYLFSVLYEIIDPVLFETETIGLVRFTEHSYNTVLLVLLGMSFLNYLDKGNKKALILFMGSVAITFSELLLIGYYYLADYKMLNYFAIILNISAFCLFYYQSALKVNENKTNVFA